MDIYGRIESFDQSVRSLDRRLRAVERRLSISKNDIKITAYENAGSDPWIDELQELRTELQNYKEMLDGLTKELENIKSNILAQLNDIVESLQHEVRTADKKIEELTTGQGSIRQDASASVESLHNMYKSEIAILKDELETAKQRLSLQENMNKISIGSIKVPVELSGIMASFALIITGYLMWTDRWDIVRSAYFPLTMAVLFALVVIVKFVFANRRPQIS